MSKKRWYVRRQLKGRIRFATEKESLHDRYKPLSRDMERVLLCWAEGRSSVAE